MFIDYMEQCLGSAKFNTSHTEANWDCPFCNDTRNRFRMHVGKLLGWCFNCEWRGNAVKFVADFNRVNWAEAFDIVNFYEDFRPLPQEVFEEVFDKLFTEGLEVETTGKYIKPPDDFTLIANTKSLQAKRFLNYAKSRKITNHQIELHGLGYCSEGKVLLPSKDGVKKETHLNNHLLVQTFGDDGKPIYWMARAIINTIQPKAFNPVGGIGTIDKSDVIFNLNNAKKTGVVVVNEGVFDAMTVGESGVALFGKTLSVKQLIQLINADLEAVYVMLDPDALESAIKIADLLSKHIKNTYLCNLKDGDPNEVGKRKCLEAIRDAERYSKLLAIKYKLS